LEETPKPLLKQETTSQHERGKEKRRVWRMKVWSHNLETVDGGTAH